MPGLSKSLPSDAWLIVGKLVAPQGLGGELRINPSSDFPERFTKPGKRWLQEKEEDPQEVELINGRQLPGKSIYIVSFAKINNRKTAEQYVGRKLLVPSSNRPKLQEDEFHFFDLVGLEARLGKNDQRIGTVVDLQNAGNDLIEIELLDGRKVLIPFVKTIVPEVQVKQGWLRINPPPGLLDL